MTGAPVLQVALLQLVLQPVTGDGRVRKNRRLRPADGGVGEEEFSYRRRRQNLFLATPTLRTNKLVCLSSMCPFQSGPNVIKLFTAVIYEHL